jgi:predicted HTH transcriptional regulator
MRKGCIKDNLPEPEFEISQSIFSICFHIRNNNKTISELYNSSAKVSTINSTINSTISEIRRQIMSLMLSNPSITRGEIAETIGIDSENVGAHIRVLKRQSLIERKGARKNGKWNVKVKDAK